MNMFNKKAGNHRQSSPQLPAIQDSASARRYHDVAAAAAQHVADMEEEIIKYRTEAEQLKVEVRSLESIRNGLESELTHSRNECDHYRHRAIDLESRLKAAASIILDVLKSVASPEPQIDEKIAQTLEDDIKALAVDPQ